jgi:hypothetical protein
MLTKSNIHQLEVVPEAFSEVLPKPHGLLEGAATALLPCLLPYLSSLLQRTLLEILLKTRKMWRPRTMKRSRKNNPPVALRLSDITQPKAIAMLQ